MSKPKRNLWKQDKRTYPRNRSQRGLKTNMVGGVPDVFASWDGLPFWIELKVTKANAVRVSPHQVAWHMASYYAREVKVFSWYKVPPPPTYICLGGIKVLN